MASSGNSPQVDSSLRNVITYIVNEANLGNDKTRNKWGEKHKPHWWPSNICYENPNGSLTTPQKWAMLFAGMSCIYKRNIHKNLKPQEWFLLRLQLMGLEHCNSKILMTCQKLRMLLQTLDENIPDILEQDWSRGIIIAKLQEHGFYPRKQGDDSNASYPLPKLDDIEKVCKINGRRPDFLAKIKSFRSMDELDAESAMKIAKECMEFKWTRKRRSKQSTKIVERDSELQCNKTVLSSKRQKTADLSAETKDSQAFIEPQRSKSSTATQVSSPSQETPLSQVTAPPQVTFPSQLTSPSQAISPSQETSPSQVSLNSLHEQSTDFQTPFVSQQSPIYQASEKEKSLQPSHGLMGSIQVQSRHSVIETLQMEKVQDNIQHNPALQIQDIQNSNQDIWRPKTQPKSVDKQTCTSSNHQILTDHVQTPSSKMTAKYPYIRKLLDQTTDTRINSLVPQTVALSGDTLPKQVQQTDSTESRHTDLNTVQQTGFTEIRHTDLNTVQQTSSTDSRHTDLNTVQQTGFTEIRHTDLNTVQQTGTTDSRHTDLNTVQQTGFTDSRHTDLNTVQQTGSTDSRHTDLNTVQQTGTTDSRHTDLNTVQQTGFTEIRHTDLNTDGISLIPVSQANVRSQSLQVTGGHLEIDSDPEMNFFRNLLDMDDLSFGNLVDIGNFSWN